MNTHDQGMFQKGYRYKLAERSGQIEPLYAKTISQCGPLMRDWPNFRFDLTQLDALDFADADALNDMLTTNGKTWAEITDTDPESVDPPTPAEMELVRFYLKRKATTL